MRYNRRVYHAHIFRVRADSDLADRIGGFKGEGNSLNYLVNCLLAAYFGVGCPAKVRYDENILRTIYPPACENADRVVNPGRF